MRLFKSFNNLVERAILLLTTQCNAMLHFGSDEGVEMAIVLSVR